MCDSNLTTYLFRWEDAYARGEDLRAEDLCPDQPEVAARLNSVIAALRRVKVHLLDDGDRYTPSVLAGLANQPLQDQSTIPPKRSGDDESAPAMVGSPAGYELVGELGHGGMGVVYTARQLGFDRLCALKMIRWAGAVPEALLAQFQREAQAVAALQHPNIVAVYEIGRYAGLPFFSLELCSGGSLDRYLGGVPLDPHEAAVLVRALAAAVHAAHLANIVHRDLKPANVLLQPITGVAENSLSDHSETHPHGNARPPLSGFIPKIADFGLAKRLDAVGDTVDGMMGTPSYMAPEQADAEGEVGPAADVYALGAILYEVLTGRPPFRAATPQDTLLQLIAIDPAPPRQLNPRVPRDLETVCLKCLRKEPAGRYASAALLADDLGRFLAGEPITARPVGAVERAVKWARRRPSLAALLLSVALLLLTGTSGAVLFALYTGQQARSLRQQMARTRQATALWDQGQQAEATGRVAMARGRDAEAARGLENARHLMERAVTALAGGQDAPEDSLRTEIEQRLQEVRTEIERVTHRLREQAQEADNRRQLQQRVADLDRARDEVLFHHLGVVESEAPANRAAVRRLASTTLAAFHLDPARPAAEAATALAPTAQLYASEDQRQQTAAACLELMMLWADAEMAAAGELTAASRSAPLQRARHLLDMARELATANRVPLPQGWYRVRAGCHQAVGDDAAARAEERQADGQPPATARDHFLLALEAFRRGRTGAALIACEEALRLQPTDFWPHYVQGLCHLRERRWAQADAWLSTCVSQRPAFVWPRVLRASARIELNNLTGAEADLAHALPRADHPVARYLIHLNRSRLAIARKRWPEARDELLRAIGCQPDTASHAHANLALVYEELGDLKLSLSHFDRAIAIRPADGRLYYTRAQLHARLQDPAAARADFEQAIRRASGSKAQWVASARVELGYQKFSAGRAADALADYDAALQVMADYPPAHRQRAEALLALNRPADAGRALDAYVKAGGGRTPAVYRARGLIHTTLGEHALAALAFTRALQLEDDPVLLAYRGWAYLRTLALPLALADFDAALKREPKHAAALCGRARIRALSGQLKQARDDAEAALRHGQPTPTLLCQLAGVHARIAKHLREPMTDGRRGAAGLARTYDVQAVQLIALAIRKSPAEQRQRLWQEQLARDPDLGPLLEHPDLRRLRPSDGGQAAPPGPRP